MRAISLWEPWGTAIAKLLKRIETRGWSTDYRGRLAIHCAKTKDHADFIFDELAGPYFRAAGIFRRTQLSFGCIVATCELVEVVPTEVLTHCGLVTEQERIFGNYGEGRFGWKLANIVPLAAPIPFRGAQGFFNVPEELLAA